MTNNKNVLRKMLRARDRQLSYVSLSIFNKELFKKLDEERKEIRLKLKEFKMDDRDYTQPIAKDNEEQFACIVRRCSGMDNGELDFGLRDCQCLNDQDQQELVDITFTLYKAMCRQLNKKAVAESWGVL